MSNKDYIKAWVIGIARNNVEDYFRSRQVTIDIDELPESELVQSRYGLVEYAPVHDTFDSLTLYYAFYQQ